MKKIHLNQLLRNRAQFNGVGQLMNATHAIQRALGMEPVAMPMASPMPTPASAPTAAPVAPASARWRGPAANDVEDAVVVDRSPRPASAPSEPAQPAAQAAPVGEFTRIALRHGPSVRHYKLFVPAAASAGKPLPLVVLLHGCTQNPDDFAAGTGMNTLAGQQGVLVLYPEQTQACNANHCWNWFRPEDQRRGSGEPALLAAMVRDAMQHHAVDPARIYVAGLSAGGAMAAVLGQQYPDLFAAVGVHSGLVAGGAHDVMSAFSAMKNGAKDQRNAPRPVSSVPTIVFHGDADSTVHPRNGEQITEATTRYTPASALHSSTHQGTAPAGRSYTRATHRSADGTVSTEQWTVHGSGHAWSGGSTAGSYTDPQGPDASAEMLRFFLAHPRKAG